MIVFRLFSDGPFVCQCRREHSCTDKGASFYVCFSCDVVFGLLLHCIKLSLLKAAGFRSCGLFIGSQILMKVLSTAFFSSVVILLLFSQVMMLKHKEFFPVFVCVMLCVLCGGTLPEFFSNDIHLWFEIQLPKHRYLIVF